MTGQGQQQVRRQMRLNLFFAAGGYHDGAWRMPGTPAGGLFTLAHLHDIAMEAERAKLDALFLADRLDTGGEAFFRFPTKFVVEPLTTLSALSAVTTRIGLIATMSTSFTEPFNLARYYASADHLSGGRVGWNIVTSFVGAENFGTALPDHDERYRQAHEFTEVVARLVLPGIMPIIAETEEAARRLSKELSDLIEFEAGRTRLRANMDGLDGLGLDDRVPRERLAAPATTQGVRGRYRLLYKLATEDGYTVRQLIKVVSSSGGTCASSEPPSKSPTPCRSGFSLVPATGSMSRRPT